MMRITETAESLEVKGHAKKHICAMVTALVVSYINGVTEVLHQPLEYTLTIGYAFIPKTTKKTLTLYEHGVRLLYEVLTKSLRQISIDYPDDVSFISLIKETTDGWLDEQAGNS